MECLLLKNSLQLNTRLAPAKLSSEKICPLSRPKHFSFAKTIYPQTIRPYLTPVCPCKSAARYARIVSEYPFSQATKVVQFA